MSYKVHTSGPPRRQAAYSIGSTSMQEAGPEARMQRGGPIV